MGFFEESVDIDSPMSYLCYFCGTKLDGSQDGYCVGCGWQVCSKCDKFDENPVNAIERSTGHHVSRHTL